MRYAELCGAPGAGKSTLLKAMQSSICPRDVMWQANARIDTGWLKECGGSRAWRIAADKSLRRAAGIRSRGGKIWAVDDHGPLQRGHWLCMDADPWTYLDHMPFPDLAVFCIAPMKVLDERIEARKKGSPKKEATVRDVPRALVSTNVMRWWAAKRKTDMLVLDMTRPVEDNAALLRERMGC